MDKGIRPTAALTKVPTVTALGRILKAGIRPIGLLGPAGVWLLLLMVLPTLLITELSLVPGLRPGQPIEGYGLLNYLRILEPTYLQVLQRSATFATGTTLLCLGLGFPVAYWLALMAPKRWRNLLLVLFILPLWTSSLLRTYAWITLLRSSGVINLVLTTLGLPPQGLMNTPWAVYVGMTYSFLPYMVLILYASLERLDLQLLEAAADLGANPRLAFWRVTVPQTLPGIAAGCLLVFVTSLGDFVVPTLLGGPNSMTISQLIYNQFLGVARNWGFGSSLSMVLILMVSMAIALLLRYGDRNPDIYS
ncbi:MAG: ABC transporter permease [Cyanobacteria bacterium P01_A01_bin.137]